ncbi:MAG: DMT family transporter [Oscillospiraceae bacterium]|nr:DMT family transporter [Oscillospiraceae bacterium]
MKARIKSTILLFLTAIIWGFAVVAQRVGADYVGPFTFNGIRFLLGACSLIPVILIFKKEKFNKEKFLKTLFVGFAAGVILFIGASLQQFGIEITGSVGKAAFLTGLYTIFVPVMRFMMGKRSSVLSFVGAAFALLGLFLLCMTGNRIAFGKGDVLLILGAVFWALHILVVDKFVNSVSPLKFSMMQFFFCGILSMIFALLTEDIQLSAIGSAGIPILYGGLMSVGIAYTCQILAQKNADPTFAAVVFSTESVFGAIGGAIILHEFMSRRGYLGCALIFIGIILSQLDLKTILKLKETKK